MTTDLTRLAAVNPHDDGYDLVPGDDVTNRRVGSVAWSEDGMGGGGLWVRLSNGDEFGGGAEAIRASLERRGYALESSSVADIATLSR